MVALAHGLKSHGVAVSLCCPSESPLAKVADRAGLDLVPIEKCGRVDFKASRRLGTLLNEGRVDILHAHNSRTALAAILAVGIARRGRVIATQHFIEPKRLMAGTLKRAVKKVAHKWMNGRIDHFIAISQAVGNAMISRGDVRSDKMTVVPNGILSPHFDELQASEIVRCQLGIGSDSPLIVCAARLEPEKDVEFLIAAMGSLKAEIPSARCVVLGEGSQRDNLQASICRFDVGKTVRLLGFRADAMSLINAADIFVLPSRAEPFGLALLEAMSLGKPVIATRAGGPIEIVVEGETGYLVPPSEPEALGSAIRKLVIDRETRVRLGLNGRRRFLECFTSEKMSRRVLSVYERTPNPAPRTTASKRNARAARY